MSTIDIQVLSDGENRLERFCHLSNQTKAMASSSNNSPSTVVRIASPTPSLTISPTCWDYLSSAVKSFARKLKYCFGLRRQYFETDETEWWHVPEEEWLERE